ncbi:hypothetical protein ANN_13876 [Periplaneta americana]|uniref:Decapping nuclease n=1 Tax=Periplaneta americana TaxID=6978 RepID=A0ABQ8SUV0_PERAM|nr:hypothetical protein ANN_13876 [Periplaneta americana]
MEVPCVPSLNMNDAFRTEGYHIEKYLLSMGLDERLGIAKEGENERGANPPYFACGMKKSHEQLSRVTSAIHARAQQCIEAEGDFEQATPSVRRHPTFEESYVMMTKWRNGDGVMYMSIVGKRENPEKNPNCDLVRHKRNYYGFFNENLKCYRNSNLFILEIKCWQTYVDSKIASTLTAKLSAACGAATLSATSMKNPRPDRNSNRDRLYVRLNVTSLGDAFSFPNVQRIE